MKKCGSVDNVTPEEMPFEAYGNDREAGVRGKGGGDYVKKDNS